MNELLAKLASAFRAFGYAIRGQTRWRHRVIEEEDVPRMETEGYERVLIRCQVCDHEEPGMIDPAQMEYNFECGQCHQLMARVVDGEEPEWA